MLLGFGINAARQRLNQPESKHSRLRCYNNSALISNVVFWNIGLAVFTELIFVRRALKSECVVDLSNCPYKIKSTDFLQEIDKALTLL